MKFLRFGAGEKTKPIQSQTKPILFISQIALGVVKQAQQRR